MFWPAGILVSAYLVNLAAYGYLRFCMTMLGGPTGAMSAALASIIILFTVIYAGLILFRQEELSGSLSLLSVAQTGVIFVGLSWV